MKKGNVKKKLLAMAMSIGIFGMAGVGFAASEVQAAEPPVISDLRVSESGDGKGIVAQCSYQSYNEHSGCDMTLYLYKKEESGQMTILMRQKLSYAASGHVGTGVYQAQEGVYFASVGIDYGSEVMQTYSQNYYRVKIVDGKVEVTEITESTENTEGAGSGSQNKTPKPDGEESEDAASACQHNLEYELERQATVNQDSLMAYQCTICGDVIDYMEVPNSAYCVFLNEAADKIKNAKADEVVIRTERWMSFDRTVLAALESRRDITVTLYYQYKGKQYSVRIPAGEDVSGLADENGYCGFLYLAQVFDGQGKVTESQELSK